MTATTPSATTWKADLPHSSVAFDIRNFLGTVTGRFRVQDVQVTYDEVATTASVEATVDAASLDTGDPQRDGHLRSPDILDVENHPTISFRSSRFDVADDGGEGTLAGDLTIKGVTRQVVLSVRLVGRDVFPLNQSEAMVVTGETEIDRRDFGVDFNMPWGQRFLLGDVLKVRVQLMLLRDGGAA